MMMIASYTNDDDCHRDDDRIVHTLTIYDAIFFGNERTDGRTDKAILGVGYCVGFPLSNATLEQISVCRKVRNSLKC